MNKKLPKHQTLYSVHLPVLILAILLTGTGAYFAHNKVTDINEDAVLGSNAKNVKAANENKPDKQPGSSAVKAKNTRLDEQVLVQPNAKDHKENVRAATKKLEEVAATALVEGDEEVSAELEEIVTEVEENLVVTSEAIEAVESKSKWKVVLFGTDYKNLGQLRSSLAHNTNTIRKLTRASENATDEATQAEIQSQLGLLALERERVMNVIYENENQFSLLGWVMKIFAGYTGGTVIDDTEDEVIDDTGTIEDGTQPADEDLQPGIEPGTEPENNVEEGTIEDGTQPETE